MVWYVDLAGDLKRIERRISAVVHRTRHHIRSRSEIMLEGLKQLGGVVKVQQVCGVGEVVCFHTEDSEVMMSWTFTPSFQQSNNASVHKTSLIRQHTKGGVEVLVS